MLAIAAMEAPAPATTCRLWLHPAADLFLCWSGSSSPPYSTHLACRMHLPSSTRRPFALKQLLTSASAVGAPPHSPLPRHHGDLQVPPSGEIAVVSSYFEVSSLLRFHLFFLFLSFGLSIEILRSGARRR